jgi:XTP/dITP diphosphohydrolase
VTRLLLATNNPGKLVEMQDLLKDLAIELVNPQQIGLRLEVDETGITYAENAALKARAFARASGSLTLADDSGLEVDALGGSPGLHSHRFSSKPNASDADRRARLLEHLQGQSRPWRAHFHCTVCICTPMQSELDGELVFSGADCQGEIIPQERGQSGFGYDPIFLLPYLQRTMAELSLPEKNRLSHRALAIIRIRPWLTELINTKKGDGGY